MPVVTQRASQQRADQVEAELEIEAPIDLVWAVLVDYASYSSWNPLLVRVEGAAREGEVLQVHCADGALVRDKTQVCVGRVDPPRELVWNDGPRGERARGWKLHALGPTRTRVVHGCWGRASSTPTETLRELGRMNVALRIHAEARFS
jgi:uncharacterized protein YndB with AHSA1/START domain